MWTSDCVSRVICSVKWPVSWFDDQVDLLECLEKKSADVVRKKRMENRFKSGLLSSGSVTDFLTVERPQMCLLCLSPLVGKCAVYSGLIMLSL